MYRLHFTIDLYPFDGSLWGCDQSGPLDQNPTLPFVPTGSCHVSRIPEASGGGIFSCTVMNASFAHQNFTNLSKRSRHEEEEGATSISPN